MAFDLLANLNQNGSNEISMSKILFELQNSTLLSGTNKSPEWKMISQSICRMAFQEMYKKEEYTKEEIKKFLDQCLKNHLFDDQFFSELMALLI